MLWYKYFCNQRFLIKYDVHNTWKKIYACNNDASKVQYRQTFKKY